jgi:ComF family protein
VGILFAKHREVFMEGLKLRRSDRAQRATGGLILQNFVKSFVDLLYPKTCQACNKPIPIAAVDGVVCLSCWAGIIMNKPPFCHACGRQLTLKDISKNICSRCVRTPVSFDRAFSACVYDGTIKTLIQGFKYKDKQFLGTPLSKLLIEFIKSFDLPIGIVDCLIPVPLHNAKLREREFNQSQILCEQVGLAFEKPVLANNLFRYRATDTQASLEPHQRFLNVRGSFAVTEKSAIKGKNVLLIDDVLTTGATVSDAARALKDAGANIVFVLTLAS